MSPTLRAAHWISGRVVYDWRTVDRVPYLFNDEYYDDIDHAEAVSRFLGRTNTLTRASDAKAEADARAAAAELARYNRMPFGEQEP